MRGAVDPQGARPDLAVATDGAEHRHAERRLQLTPALDPGVQGVADHRDPEADQKAEQHAEHQVEGGARSDEIRRRLRQLEHLGHDGGTAGRVGGLLDRRHVLDERVPDRVRDADRPVRRAVGDRRRDERRVGGGRHRDPVRELLRCLRQAHDRDHLARQPPAAHQLDVGADPLGGHLVAARGHRGSRVGLGRDDHRDRCRVLAGHQVAREDGGEEPDEQPRDDGAPPLPRDVDELAGRHPPTNHFTGASTTTPSPSSAGPPLHTGAHCQRRTSDTRRSTDVRVRRLAAPKRPEEALDGPEHRPFEVENL